MLEITDTSKPDVGKLAAKVHPEPASITMEAPDLPDFYKDMVTRFLCIVSLAKAAKISKGGIHFADVSVEAVDYCAQIGKLVAVGPFFYSEKRRAGSESPKVGDFVMFEPHVGRRFDLNGDTFMILEDKHILLRKIRPEDDFKLYA